MEYVNKLFLNLDLVHRNSTQGGFAYIRQSKWVGISATERTQIHFLGDVVVAVASSDLKVPNSDIKQTWTAAKKTSTGSHGRFSQHNLHNHLAVHLTSRRRVPGFWRYLENVSLFVNFTLLNHIYQYL